MPNHDAPRPEIPRKSIALAEPMPKIVPLLTTIVAACSAFTPPCTFTVHTVTQRTIRMALQQDTPMGERITAQVNAFFNSIDDNGDGVISFEELAAHLEGQGFAQGAVEHVFDLLDINRDGEIEAEELREALVKFDDPAIRLAIGLGATEADDVFDAIDTNSDGEVTIAELTAYLELNSCATEEATVSASKIFRTLDANGDGSIQREELRQGYEEYTEFRAILGLQRSVGF